MNLTTGMTFRGLKQVSIILISLPLGMKEVTA